MNGLFRRVGLLPNIVLEVETIEDLQTHGASKIRSRLSAPDCGPRRTATAERLVSLEITDAETLRRSLDVIVPRRRPLSQCRATARKVAGGDACHPGQKTAWQTIVRGCKPLASSRSRCVQ